MTIGDLHIIKSFRMLKGNARVAVATSPLSAVPFVLYNFYMSLYMKSRGVTDEQLGYIVSIGFLSAAFVTFFGGLIVDTLGRKRTSVIADMVLAPVVLTIWIFADNFWMFAIAAVINSQASIGGIAYSCMLVEDATSEQRVSAYNMNNIIFICAGVLIPLVGISMQILGLVAAERIFLLFALVCIITMGFLRYRFYSETKMGQRILEERKTQGLSLKKVFHITTFKAIVKNHSIMIAMAALILYNAFIVLGSFSNVYYMPYLTEQLGINRSAASAFGVCMSLVLLFCFLVVVPFIIGRSKKVNMACGLVIQITALVIFMLTPRGGFQLALLSTVVYAMGNGIIRPFIDSLLADAAEGRERASIYSVNTLLVCVANTAAGILAGRIYGMKPVLIYAAAAFVLFMIFIILMIGIKLEMLGDKGLNRGQQAPTG